MPRLSNKNTSTDIVFEKAKPGDEERLEPLYQSAFDYYVRLLGRDPSDWSYDWLPGSIGEGTIWIAVQEADIIGAVTLVPEGDNWLIDEIVVSPQLQGRGIGSWMLEKVEALASGQGVKKLSLCTVKMRADLIRLYKRFGFVVVREGLAEHDLDPHIRVFMEKLLD